jgi:hypothetical protein
MAGIDGSAIPPLQAFSWLSARAFDTGASFSTTPALKLLGQYLHSQSCNPSEVEALRQWDQQVNRGAVVLYDNGVDLETLERTVTSKAAAVRAVLDENKGKTALMTSTVSGAAAANRAGAPPESTSRGPMTSLVQWWHLGGSGSPWSFALHQDVNESRQHAQEGDYCFSCLRDVMDLIGPFLNTMRCAAALGAEDAVSAAYVNGAAYVSSGCARSEATSIFASLELGRTLVTLSFGTRAGVAGVARALQAARPFEELRRMTGLLDRFDMKEDNTQETHRPPSTTDSTSGTLMKAQAYWRLAVSYSVFFHTVAAYLDGIKGNFEQFAAAVLGTGEGQQAGLCLWGASRFPFLAFAVAENNNAAAAAGRGGEINRDASNAPATVHTRLATLFPSSSSHVIGGGADYYLAEYKPLVTQVIAPARVFSTLLILSAVATLPLQVVTRHLPLWGELRELYENCEELESVLRALQEGQLGVAWRSSNAAATTYLVNTPYLPSAVMDKLLEGVKRAICFHYLNTRGAVSMAHAAKDLCFDSTEEFAHVVTGLIRDQFIDARIDLVNRKVQLQKEGSRHGDDGAGTEEAAARAVLGLSTLEMQFTCMSAERNLIFVPASSGD